jgi:hypothetical protein
MPPMSESPTAPVPAECRQWLSGLADVLIPAGAVMPAASAVDVSGRQLDRVLAARPDLDHLLRRGWGQAGDTGGSAALDALKELDAEAYEAICLIVAGGYYIHPEVRRLLGYTGQQPRAVRVDQVPEYIEEGLLERVMERGAIYREA